ncbi:MAG: hypothetical protein D6788_05465 [Planctomycetota bacterium]|nr:MAG: hypothetical protein D6788_05465 [Planctomycetota bacterium]
MIEWIWFADAPRVTQVAVVRASPASSRFARIHLLWLCGVAGLLCASRTGWARQMPEIMPRGQGWLRIGPATGGPGDQVPLLWWNPAQFLIAWATAAVTALVGVLLLGTLVRSGLRGAHLPPYRQQGRLQAALHYATAWSPPVILGILILSVSPLIAFLRARGWDVSPVQLELDLGGGVLALLGLVMWWFFLLRVANCAPPCTRGRLTVFVAVGIPLLTGLFAAAWWIGLRLSLPPLFTYLGLRF